MEYFTPDDQLGAIDVWATEWSRQVPGCDARRAAELVRPLHSRLDGLPQRLRCGSARGVTPGQPLGVPMARSIAASAAVGTW